MMPTVINELSGYENDAVMVNTMWDACHRNLYALVNSAAMNGVGKNTTVKVTELYLTPALQTVAVICGLIAHAAFSQSIGNMLAVARGREIVDHAVLL